MSFWWLMSSQQLYPPSTGADCKAKWMRRFKSDAVDLRKGWRVDSMFRGGLCIKWRMLYWGWRWICIQNLTYGYKPCLAEKKEMAHAMSRKLIVCAAELPVKGSGAQPFRTSEKSCYSSTDNGEKPEKRHPFPKQEPPLHLRQESRLSMIMCFSLARPPDPPDIR